MVKTSWKLAYGIAIFLDFFGAITLALGWGLILNRIIDVFATLGFIFYFYVTGAKGWWRIIVSGVAEEVPFLGDLSPFWTFAVWRVHKKNAASDAANIAGKVVGEVVKVGVAEVAGPTVGNFAGNTAESLTKRRLQGRETENREEIVQRQIDEDEGYQEQLA